MPNNQIKATFCHHLCANVKNRNQYNLERASQMALAQWVNNPPTIQETQVDLSSILESGRSPGGGHGNSLQYSCLEEFHGQRSLVGYSP